MAAKFGKTWWGASWLNALSNIDYENRIPRGATYARKGAVTGLKVKDNIVEAKVQGSRRTPYKVMLVLPKFAQEDVDRLIDALLMRPALISELFQRQLSPAIAEIARDCGLKLFPSQWSDIKMNCNCPDWAVPCKHLAAVIYMLSREIDNNPFMVFEMHGIHLLEELKQRGVNLDSDISKIQPMPFAEYLVKADTKVRQRLSESSEPKAIDYTRLTPMSDVNTVLLPDEPPFYVNGNFKELYTQAVVRCAKSAQRYLNGRLKAEALFVTAAEPSIITSDTVLSFEINDALEVKSMLNECGVEGNVDLNQLVQGILALNPDFLPDYDTTVCAMHTIVYAAIHFTANNLIKPEIIKTGANDYRMAWVPLPSDTEVQTIMESIEAKMPPGMLRVMPRGHKRGWQTGRPGAVMVSALIGAMVRSLSAPKGDDSVTDLFFRGSMQSFNGIGQTEIPGAIRAWTDRLILTGTRWQPLLYVADKEGDDGLFSLTIGLEGEDGHRYELRDILSLPQWDGSRFEILQTVMRLSAVVPGLVAYINMGALGAIEFGDAEFVDFITQIVPAMRMLGLKVYLPKSLQHLLKPKPSLRITERVSESGMFSVNDFFAYDWRIAVGDELVDTKEFEAMISKAEGLIRFKKSYIYVSAEDLAKLKARLRSHVELTPVQLFQAALSEEYDSAPVELSDGARAKIQEIRSYGDIAVPDGLNATLRPSGSEGSHGCTVICA